MQPTVPSTVQACHVTPDFSSPPVPESQGRTPDGTSIWKQFMTGTSSSTGTHWPRPDSSHTIEPYQLDFSVVPSPSFQQLNQFLQDYSLTHPSYCTADFQDDWAQFDVFDDHHMGPRDQH